ncbi:Hypothetical predicted protein [Cloeon dipterum]|uniref:RAP domain-containing protein n=1 Tax=Cloeon dipterum TaxID=197152 RepID=A0A8S1CV12_9INSE|nr:Hypothetical predicted protein [Cloeon dipterum]
MFHRGKQIFWKLPRLIFKPTTFSVRGAKVAHASRILTRVPKPHSLGYLSSRNFSSEELIVSDSDQDIEPALDVKDELSSETYRAFLYPNETLPLFKQLNEAKSVQDIFAFMHKHKDELNPILVSQAVMVLWDLQRLFLQYCTEEFLADSIAELKSYIKAVNGHPDFNALLRSISDHCEDLKPDALTCLLLYLGKMGVQLTHPTMQKLLLVSSGKIDQFPLTALSRFLVALQTGYNMKTIEWCRPAVPIVLEKLQNVKEAEDFRLVTISLSHLHPFMTPKILKLLFSKARELLEEGVLGPHTPKAVVKILNFSNYTRALKPEPDLINSLMLTLEGNISKLRVGDVVSLIRCTENFMQPSKIAEELNEYVLSCLSQMEPLTLPIDLFNGTLIATSLNPSISFVEKLIEDHIRSASFSSNITPLFKLLRFIKTPNRELCDLYWNRIALHLKRFPKDINLLLNIVFKYMHFNNNMGGTYRNEKFEKVACDMIHDLMKTPMQFVTSFVSRSVAFLVAYSPEELPAEVMTRTMNMADQFSVVDCHNISRGIKMATTIKGSPKNPVMLDQIVKLNSVVSSSIRNHLFTGDLSLVQNDSLFRTYQNIRGTPGTDLYEQLLMNYSKITPFELSGRLLKDMSASFINNKTLVPSAVDVMQEFVIRRNDDLMESVKCASKIMLRDCEKMSVLSLLMATIALDFYHQVPMDLIHFIFTVDFLERVDQELKSCYSRAVYPLRVRQAMMELNRAVCLDYPEADIPWFHEKYCQENITPFANNSALHKEVFKTIKNVVGGADFVKQSTFSSYYYNLDFEVALDENERPINVKENRDLSDRNIRRVAIVLNRDFNFTNGVVQPTGSAVLRRRHLEILGYRQVQISRFIWQAMFMSDESTRQKFIAEQIWPQRRAASSQNIVDGDDFVLT